MKKKMFSKIEIFRYVLGFLWCILSLFIFDWGLRHISSNYFYALGELILSACIFFGITALIFPEYNSKTDNYL